MAYLKGFPPRFKNTKPEDCVGERWIEYLKDARFNLCAGGIAVFYGGCGTGKTRMSYEIAKISKPRAVNVSGMSKEMPRIYLTAAEFMDKLRQGYTDKDADSERNIMEELAQATLLVIDEIDNCIATDFGQRKIKQIVDDRYRKELPTILITNLDRKALAKLLPEPVLDRIRECGKGYHFNWPSFRGKINLA